MARIITLLMVIYSFAVKGQWTSNTLLNTEVRDSSGTEEVTPLSATTSEGKTYVCFFESHSGSYRLMMQLLDSNGYKLWPAAGIVVSAFPQSSALYRYDLKVDENDHAVVAFQDIRSGNLGVVVYKIDLNGSLIWGTNGIPLTDSLASEGLAPVIGITSANNVVVAWNSDNGSDKWISFRKIDPSGNMLWPDVVRVFDAAAIKKYSRPSIVASGIDDFIMLYVEEAGSFPGTVSTMYAQQYDLTGAAIWALPQQVSVKTIPYFFFPVAVADGNGGLFVDFNTSNANFPSQTDVYVQHVASSGVLWNSTGVIASTLSNTQHFASGSRFDASSNALWVLLKVTDIGQNSSGIYIQKLDSAGTVQFAANGVQLAAVSSAYNDPRGHSVTSDGVITVFSTGSNTFAQTLSAIKCDFTGALMWNATPVVICNNSSGKDDLTAGSFKNDQVVFVWDDSRNDFGVYAQNITNGGQTGIVTSVPLNEADLMLQVTPVPFGDRMQIRINDKEYGLAIRIADITGKIIADEVRWQEEMIFHTEEWPAGMYFVIYKNTVCKAVKY